MLVNLYDTGTGILWKDLSPGRYEFYNAKRIKITHTLPVAPWALWVSDYLNNGNNTGVMNFFLSPEIYFVLLGKPLNNILSGIYDYHLLGIFWDGPSRRTIRGKFSYCYDLKHLFFKFYSNIYHIWNWSN